MGLAELELELEPEVELVLGPEVIEDGLEVVDVEKPLLLPAAVPEVEPDCVTEPELDAEPELEAETGQDPPSCRFWLPEQVPHSSCSAS